MSDKLDSYKDKLRMHFSQNGDDGDPRTWQELKEYAQKDTLSKLKRREELFKDLGEKGVKDTTVLFFDIDKFKEVNDKHGDSYGDEVISIMGMRLIGKFSEVYRKGGEEFVVILRGVNKSKAKERAEDFRQYMQDNPIVSKDGTVFAKTVSGGIADGNDYANPEELIKAAGDMMHLAKDAGRNRVFVDGLDNEITRRDANYVAE